MIALGRRDHHACVLALTMAAAFLAAPGALGDVYIPAGVHDVDLLSNGHLFVTDGGRAWDPNASGVFEIDRDGNILWSFAAGLNFAHNADQRPDHSAIISDTGHDRVIIVDLDGMTVWNSDDITLSDGSTLQYPNDANLLLCGNRLITDRNNHRVIEIDALGNIVWQFGETGVPGDGPAHLFGPHNADRLANGNTIICDSNNNRIIEVNPAGVIVWGYAGSLNWPRDADRLSDGHTLIDDSNNHRIIEVTFGGAIVWEYPVEGLSYDADRLPSGNTLISVDDRIIEVQPDGVIVWSYPPYLTDEVWVLNPTSGIELYCHIHRPVGFDSETIYPGVVLVPGGSAAGTSFDDGGLAQDYANQGFIVMHFDPDGRGESTNGGAYTEEDYNGFLHQDGLRAVLQHLVGLPETDDCKIGVLSGSYGITMAAGTLARYLDSPRVKYLIDWEGPADRTDTAQPHGHVPHDPNDDAWWYEREATNFIGDFTGYYIRMQSEIDHAQPDNDHAILLINGATHVDYGGTGHCFWTRVNSESGLTHNLPNMTYTPADPPEWLPEFVAAKLIQREYMIELADMAPLPIVGDLDGNGTVDLADLGRLLAYYGTADGAAYEDGDLDGDSDVDLGDLAALLAVYGTTCP
jgi:hypothetical protein